VNFYKHFLGDYARDTAHLAMLEHGAYRLMLDHYYATGKSLPAEKPLLYRICKASSKVERTAVDLVADTFFPVNGDGTRHNKRADEEIGEAVAYAEAQAKRANKRWHVPMDMQAHMPVQSPTDASHSHSQIKEKSKAMSGKPDVKPLAIEILNFLNLKAQRAYRPTESNLGLIVARLKDGATLRDCKQVIAKKVREWGTDEKMGQYLRPATLFNRTKFDQYVGELVESQDAA
jgi:uncharacterized phage protein (TIGR02220 family)